MSEFKLLAIRILPGCEYYFKKNLNTEDVYKFYDGYKFSFLEDNAANDINKVEPLHIQTPRLYTISREGPLGDLEVNISALVGMNGSGKSSLLELFYAFCFCLSQNELGFIDTLESSKGDLPYLAEDIIQTTNNLAIEVFYSIDDSVKSIKYKNGSIGHFKYNPSRKEDKSVTIEQFCYSIALNYSLYGLNETENPWMRLMFHKNDGYQSPLVINPMRTEGNIDINKEFDLSQARLMLNLAESRTRNIEIVKGKFLSEINFSIKPYNLKTIRYFKGKIDLNKFLNYHEEKHSESRYDIYNNLVSKIFVRPPKLTATEINKYKEIDKSGLEEFIENEYHNNENKLGVDYSDLKYLLVNYVIKKIFKIALNYPQIRKNYIEIPVYSSPFPYVKKTLSDSLLNLLVKDDSHMTFKLKQAIYTIANKTIEKFIWSRRIYSDYSPNDKSITETENNIYNDFEFVSKVEIINLKKTKGRKEKIELYFKDIHKVPCAFIKPEFNYLLKDGLDSRTKKMSSGEQQYFQSINTIIYHLRNIDSVKKSSTQKKTYQFVSIILDEIELYYHPEYQRNYISDLLRNIKQTKLKNINSINILFSTHSPFILSDIPSSNTLRLNDGYVVENGFKETFGANIHDLLANDFFLSNGFMGEFAKEKINLTIQYLTYHVNKKELNKLNNELQSNNKLANYKVLRRKAFELENKYLEKMEFDLSIESKNIHKKIIILVGEQIIKSKLQEMYNLAFDEKIDA